MANMDTPCGFKPYGKLLRLKPYPKASTDSTAIYPGDVVYTVAGYIASASAGGAVRGVANNYAAGDVAGIVYVWDDPQQEFVGQDDASATLTQAEVGENCDILATAGDSTLKESRMELNVTTHATTAATFRIVDVANTIYPNGVANAVGDNANWVCQINEHERKSTTGT